MNILQARIILKKRKECSERLKRYGENCGRCSPCPLRTSLDEYIEAKRIIEETPILADSVWKGERHGSNESENGND